MKSQRNKLKQEIMAIEDVLIKSIKVNNQQSTLKELYLVIEVDSNKWVGCVRSIPFGDTTLFQQFQTLSIPIKSSSQAFIRLWNYETVKEITTVPLPTKLQHNPLTIKLNPPNLQIQIYFQTQTLNSKHLQYLQESFKNHKFSLPSLKKRLCKRNSLKLKPQGSNQTSAVLYPLYQPSQNSLVYIEDSSQNETSLEKILTKDIKTKDCNLKGQDSNNLDQIKLLENKNAVKAANTRNFYDDYEARPKQISKKSNFESEKTKQAVSKDKIANALNSTTSSSTVKRNLQNVISILTKKAQTGNPSQRNSFHIQSKKNNPRQFFDYGLIQSKKMQRNLKMKYENKKYQPINKQEKLQQFYEKHLTKRQIQKLAKMTSFELSKSIFQQYGLDLSLTKIYSSKQFEKRKFLDLERPQTKQAKKSKNSAEMKKIGKKLREKGKNDKHNNLNKFQDYGECLLEKKARSSKSLRRMERPK